MIKSKKGNIKANGSVRELLGDLGVIVKALHDNFSKDIGEDASRNLLKTAFDSALMTEEEIEQAMKQHLINLGELLIKHAESEGEADE